MNISQLNGTYVAPEDRILLRVSTDAGEEFRLWLTRATTGQLLGAIHGAAARAIAEKYPPELAQTVAEFEQQAVQAETRFDRQYLPGATLPLGNAPALVLRADAMGREAGLALGLTLQNGKKVDLWLPRRLAQQVGVLIDRLQRNANWSLDQPAPQPAPGEACDTAAADAARQKKLVH
jgi:hypothetical protein